MKSEKEIILEKLIVRALHGDITLEELYTFENIISDKEPLYLEIFHDIEQAVEHFPASFLKGYPLYEAFQNTKEYIKLIEDLNILRKNI
ncbi:MAG TPA: hypothetical protein DCL86_13730 [Bacteroidales bacterium]|jgi:hypothetical protein|nr:hypothetical protein [Bacteroidales bacterium]